MGALRKEGGSSAPDGSAAFKVISLSTRREIYSSLSFEVPQVSEAPQKNFIAAAKEKVIFLTRKVESPVFSDLDSISSAPVKPVEEYRGHQRRIRDLPLVRPIYDWWHVHSSF